MKSLKDKTFKAGQKVFLADLGLYGLIGYIISVSPINNKFLLKVGFNNNSESYIFDTDVDKIEII